MHPAIAPVFSLLLLQLIPIMHYAQITAFAPYHFHDGSFAPGR